MKLQMNGIKNAPPWAPVLATLNTLEKRITQGEHDAMEARWLFGRELLKHRKEYKGRQVVPADLMKLAMEKCERSKRDIHERIKFAERFETKDLMRNALRDYPSWRQMITVGLIDKKKTVPRKGKKTSTHSGPFIIGRLTQEVDRAFASHARLTRDEVNDLEILARKIQELLARIDQNDAAKAG